MKIFINKLKLRLKKIFIKNCLIIREGMLGDVISIEPLIRALRNKGFKNIAVDVGIFDPVFKNNPYLIPLKKLKKHSYSTFNLNGVTESNLELLREDSYLNFCDATLHPKKKLPKIYLSAEEISYGEDLFKSGSWIIVDAGYVSESFFCGKINGKLIKWKRAQFNINEWNNLIVGLNRLGFKVAQVGNQKNSHKLNCDLDLRFKTNLRELFCILYASKYFIGMESGPMHAAQALGLKGIAFFNPYHTYESLCPPGSRIVPVYRSFGEIMNHKEILKLFKRYYYD